MNEEFEARMAALENGTTKAFEALWDALDELADFLRAVIDGIEKVKDALQKAAADCEPGVRKTP